jgi:hypothetical protein
MNALRTIVAGAFLAGLAAAQTISITNVTLPNGTVNVSYTAGLSQTGGVAPLTWSATNLPPGLVINNGTGVIAGTPVTAGTFLTTVSLSDSRGFANSRQYSIVIAAPKVAIGTGNPLPSGTVGLAYNQLLTATGGTAPYRWSVGLGFPTFFTLGATTGTITGTPTASGTFSFPITVTDNTGGSATITFNLIVNPAILAITTIPPLFNGNVGTAYAQTFSASGGVPPYTWALISGSAPAGLSLDPITGILQGTPQSAGTSSFTLQVTDKAGTSVSQNYSIDVKQPALTLTVAGTLPAGAVGVSYSQKLPVAASGGTPPYSWSIVGSTVPGLVFDSAGVALAGTPTTAGTFNMTVQVADSSGLTATKSLSLTVAPAGLSITSVRQLRDTPFNQPFSQALAATGGTPPYTWSANGLPTGLAIDLNSGLISGTPNAAGSFSFAVTVTDSALKQFSDRFSINVTLPQTPSVSLTGIGSSIGAVQQMPLQITLDSAFPVTITGQAFLSFAPESGPQDRTIQFASGGTVASFSIPAGSTTATSSIPLALQTGTVAGTITITLRLQAGVTDVTPSPAPQITAQVTRATPVVSDVQVNRTSNALGVVLTGYTTAREITQITYNFSAASGQTLQPSASSITVSVDSIFANWYQDAVNGQYGSQFVFTQPFTIQGDPNLVTVTSVVVTNRVGSSTVTVNK